MTRPGTLRRPSSVSGKGKSEITNQPPGSRASWTRRVTWSMSRHSCMEMLLTTRAAGSGTSKSSSGLQISRTRSARPASATRAVATSIECWSPSTPTSRLSG